MLTLTSTQETSRELFKKTIKLHSCVPFEAKLIWQINTSNAKQRHVFHGAFSQHFVNGRPTPEFPNPVAAVPVPDQREHPGGCRTPPTKRFVVQMYTRQTSMSNVNGEPSLRFRSPFHAAVKWVLCWTLWSIYVLEENLMVSGLQSVRPLCLKNTCSWILGQRPCLLMTLLLP